MNGRTVTCPGCGGESTLVSDNPWRPFCCERCSQHDFGAWASESYRVAAKPPDDGGESVDDDLTPLNPAGSPL